VGDHKRSEYVTDFRTAAELFAVKDPQTRRDNTARRPTACLSDGARYEPRTLCHMPLTVTPHRRPLWAAPTWAALPIGQLRGLS